MATTTVLSWAGAWLLVSSGSCVCTGSGPVRSRSSVAVKGWGLGLRQVTLNENWMTTGTLGGRPWPFWVLLLFWPTGRPSMVQSSTANRRSTRRR